MQNDSKRIIYLDLLRIIATFMVIILHIAGGPWQSLPIHSINWQAANIYDSIVRCSVPLFVMISGALFLDPNKNITIKQIFSKYISRLVIAFLFWQIIYCSYYFFTVSTDIKSIIILFVTGYYHLWFLYMICGLYLITPILRKITEDEKITKYFLILALFFNSIIPLLLKIPILSYFNTPFNNIVYHLTLGYSSYYVLGYYLSKKDLSKKQRKIIYGCSLLGFITVILGTIMLSNYNNKADELLFATSYLPVVLESIGLFVLVKYSKNCFTNKTKQLIFNLSKYSFGIYLSHALVIDLLSNLKINVYFANLFITIPLLALLIFIISLIISFILNKIPIIKKYIV